MNKKAKSFWLMISLAILISVIIAFFANADCCTKFCLNGISSCPSGETSSLECKTIESCKIGCCVENGFMHNKYPKSLCEKKGGDFFNSECIDVSACKAD